MIIKQLKCTINFLGWNGQDFFFPPKWILFHNEITAANFHGEHAAAGPFFCGVQGQVQNASKLSFPRIFVGPGNDSMLLFAGVSKRRS